MELHYLDNLTLTIDYKKDYKVISYSCRMDERCDPSIAVLLLVALTVFLGVGFFVWSRAYLSKTSTQGS